MTDADLADLEHDFNALAREIAEQLGIRPGADPRAQWAIGWIDRGLSLDDSARVFEAGDRARPVPVTVITASRRDYYRYVPFDVVRWRDPEHRAELTRRARELAAAVRLAGGE